MNPQKEKFYSLVPSLKNKVTPCSAQNNFGVNKVYLTHHSPVNYICVYLVIIILGKDFLLFDTRSLPELILYALIPTNSPHCSENRMELQIY